MKAKPVKITKMDKKDSYGNTSFIIEFDNGEKGFYTSKSEDQKKFVIGNVADYELEVKQGSKGPYNKITVPITDSFFKGGGGRPVVEPRFQFIGFSCAYSKDLVVAGKIDIKDMYSTSEEIFKTMIKLYESVK